MWIWYLFLSIPTLIPSLMISRCYPITDIHHKLGKLYCFTLIMYLGSYESALIIFIHFTTCKTCSLWNFVHLQPNLRRQVVSGQHQILLPAADSTTSELSLLNAILNLFDLPRVRTLTLYFQQGNNPLIQSTDGLMVPLWLSSGWHLGNLAF